MWNFFVYVVSGVVGYAILDFGVRAVISANDIVKRASLVIMTKPDQSISDRLYELERAGKPKVFERKIRESGPKPESRE